MSQETKIITIVGGTGFIGRYVVKHLAKAGYRIRVISRNAESALELKTAGDPGQILLVSGNVAKPESLQLAASYAVINLVGILFESGKQSFNAVQTTGAEKLAQAAKAAGAQVFVQMSALGADKASGSHYARSKLMGEKAVQSAFPTATILRPSVVFGEEDNFFNQFASMASFSPALPLIGGGTTKFQPVYVDDVAKAIEAALTNKNMRGKTYELGGLGTYSFKEILQFITATIHKPRCLTTLPYGLANVVGFFNELLPRPMITRDQIKLLKHDNVVSENALTFADIGITPQSVEAIVPHYLARFAPYLKVAA